MTRLHRVAQDLARNGWHVFPCVEQGKQPHPCLGAHGGLNHATRDDLMIDLWWTAHPEANVGIVPGLSDVVVVDLDLKDEKDGFASIEAADPDLYAEVAGALAGGGGLPLVRTPSGGMHVYLRGACSSRNGRLEGVDIKSLGGYVLAPGSEAGDGPNPARYELLTDGPFVPEAIVTPVPMPLTGPKRPSVSSPLPEDREPTTETALREALDLAGYDPDNRDDWVEVGQILHTALTDGNPREIWDEWSLQSAKFDAADQERVWRSFHADRPGVGVGTLFKRARAAGWTGSAHPTRTIAEVFTVETDSDEPAEVLPFPEIFSGAELDGAYAPVEMVIDGLIPRGGVTLFIGGFDAGKTAATIGLGLAVASDRDWCGYTLARQGLHVFFFAGEGHELASEYAAAYVRSTLGGQWPERFHFTGWAPSLSEDDQLRRAREMVLSRTKGAECLIIADSWSRMAAGAEDRNNEAEVQRLINRAEALAKAVNGTLIALGHPVKTELGEQPTSLSGSQQAMNSAMASIAFWNPHGTKEDLQKRAADGTAVRYLKPMRVRGVATPERRSIRLASYEFVTRHGTAANRPVATSYDDPNTGLTKTQVTARAVFDAIREEGLIDACLEAGTEAPRKDLILDRLPKLLAADARRLLTPGQVYPVHGTPYDLACRAMDAQRIYLTPRIDPG